jgi:hypothetical protein
LDGEPFSFFGEIYGLPPQVIRERCRQLLAVLTLEPDGKKIALNRSAPPLSSASTVGSGIENSTVTLPLSHETTRHSSAAAGTETERRTSMIASDVFMQPSS